MTNYHDYSFFSFLNSAVQINTNDWLWLQCTLWIPHKIGKNMTQLCVTFSSMSLWRSCDDSTDTCKRNQNLPDFYRDGGRESQCVVFSIILSTLLLLVFFFVPYFCLRSATTTAPIESDSVLEATLMLTD